jgi:hypothetical protein
VHSNIKAAGGQIPSTQGGTMGESEKQAPLEADDLEKLDLEGGAPVGCSILLALVFILPVLFMLTWGFSWFQVLLILLTLGLGGLSVFLYFRHALEEKRKAGMDIKGGVKRIFTSPMESQEMKSRAKTRRRRGALMAHETGELEMSYFIKVNGKDYEVPIETYMAIRPGELVEIHEGIHSGVPLRVLKSERP